MTAPSGGSAKSAGGTVYIKRHDEAFSPFNWMGECSRIGDITESQGGVTPTTKQDRRTGQIVRDGGLLAEIPGPTTFDIAMKKYIADRKASDLKKCFFDVDKRYQCRDFDSPMVWEEILRNCKTKFGQMVTMGTDWEGEAETLVTGSGTALFSHEIFRVTGEGSEDEIAEAVNITDLSVSRPEGCPTCDDQVDCVIVAVSSLAAAATPYMYVNLAGGDLDQWSAAIPLVGWAAAGADCVVALGDFVVIGSAGESEIIYSDDLGTTQVIVGTNLTGPNDLDALDQTFIVGVEQAGIVVVSTDAARTWEVSDNAEATVQNLTNVMIARDDPQTIYACGAANALIKTINGGENWFALTGPSAGDALSSLWVKNKYNLLIGNDDGELWESTDGGITWTQQNELPDTPAAASLVSLTGCGCGVMYAVMKDTAAAAHVIYRNVDDGASGKWYHSYTAFGTTTTYEAPTQDPAVVACCGPNRAVVGGGETVQSWIYLLA